MSFSAMASLNSSAPFIALTSARGGMVRHKGFLVGHHVTEHWRPQTLWYLEHS